MIKSILLLHFFYRLLQFTLFTNVLNLQNFKTVDKRISMKRSEGQDQAIEIVNIENPYSSSVFSSTVISFSFNASPNRHKKPTISGEIFGIVGEKKLKDLYSQQTSHYIVSYIKQIYDFTKALTHLLGEEKEEDRKKGTHFRIRYKTVLPFFILFVNNALMPHESFCLKPIHERRKIATTMETHFS